MSLFAKGESTGTSALVIAIAAIGLFIGMLLTNSLLRKIQRATEQAEDVAAHTLEPRPAAVVKGPRVLGGDGTRESPRRISLPPGTCSEAVKAVKGQCIYFDEVNPEIRAFKVQYGRGNQWVDRVPGEFVTATFWRFCSLLSDQDAVAIYSIYPKPAEGCVERK